MAETKRDYYEVLGLSKGASDDEIKRAYRKLAKQYHPDLHPGDKAAEKKFKEVNEAYAVLSDSDKKAKYDQFGFAGVDPNFGGGAGGYGTYSTNIDFGDFGDIGDIFGSFFGGGIGRRSSRSSAVPGEDISAQVNLTFKEAVFGCQKKIRIRRSEDCPDCKGSGAAAGSEPQTCKTCSGTGVVRQVSRTVFGNMQTERTCSACGGTGKVISDPCKSCGGSGQVRRERVITVTVPAGIANGQTIVVRGEGGKGLKGGPNGDVRVGVYVGTDPIFTRRDADLYCEIPITVTQAILGCEIDVPLIDGESMKHKLAEGTQSHTVINFKGKGVPYLNSKGRGNMYVTIVVETPRNLTGKQKELVRKLDSEMSGKSYERSKSFWDKVKSRLS